MRGAFALPPRIGLILQRGRAEGKVFGRRKGVEEEGSRKVEAPKLLYSFTPLLLFSCPRPLPTLFVGDDF
jgi:hypothetical protein